MDSILQMIVCGLNLIIEEAVSDGGDGGGPYNTNKEGLRSAMKQFIKSVCIEDKVEVVEIEWPESRDHYAELQFRIRK